MKEQNRAEIQELLTKVPQGTPEFQMLMLQYFTLLDGKGVEMMREYANKQLVMMGLKKPETPEEMGDGATGATAAAAAISRANSGAGYPCRKVRLNCSRQKNQQARTAG